MLFFAVKVFALLGLLFLAGLGAFVLFSILRPQKSPADTSNRINKIRLIWFALRREDLFVPFFEWLKHDELVNVTKK